MKAVVWHDVGKVSVDDVPEPRIQDPADAKSGPAAGEAEKLVGQFADEGMPTVLQAYESFDRREPGWTKVRLELG